MLDVVDTDPGRLHIVDAPLAEATTVRGAIDWSSDSTTCSSTGQHVLSAAFDRLFGVHAESHLGITSATIDLAREVSVGEVQKAEDEANRIVWEDRPVAIRIATPDEAANLPLRKASLRSADPSHRGCDFDLSACGGTHVSRTGAIGIVAITGTDKLRGGSRIEFALRWPSALQGS